MDKKDKIILIIIIVFILSCVVLAILIGRSKIKKPIIVGDNPITTKIKDGKEYSKTTVITGINKKDFLELETKNEEIRKLQKLVRDYKKELSRKGNITNFKTITKFDTVFYKKDSIDKNLSIFDSINNKWITTKFGFNKGNTEYSLSINNEYSVIVGEEYNGFFKPRKPFVEIINHNPYSKVNAIKTFDVSLPSVKHFSIGPMVGYGIGPDFKFSPFLGVGIQYSIIRF